MIPFALANWRILAGIGLALTLTALLTAFGAHQFHRGAESVREADRKAVAAAQRLTDEANRKAAVQRNLDQATIEALRRDLSDAAKNLPDSVPGPVRTALGCARLRGTPAASRPEFSARCGPPAPAKAGPVR